MMWIPNVARAHLWPLLTSHQIKPPGHIPATTGMWRMVPEVRKGWQGVSQMTCTNHAEEPAFLAPLVALSPQSAARTWDWGMCLKGGGTLKMVLGVCCLQTSYRQNTPTHTVNARPTLPQLTHLMLLSFEVRRLLEQLSNHGC